MTTSCLPMVEETSCESTAKENESTANADQASSEEFVGPQCSTLAKTPPWRCLCRRPTAARTSRTPVDHFRMATSEDENDSYLRLKRGFSGAFSVAEGCFAD
jgi:hypothetical protein